MSKRVDKILETIDEALAEPWAAGAQSSYEASYGGDPEGCVRCGALAEPSGWCAACHPRNDAPDPIERLKAIAEENMASVAGESPEERRAWLFQRVPRLRASAPLVPWWFQPAPGCRCEICAEARRLGIPERGLTVAPGASATVVYPPGAEVPAPVVEPGMMVTIERRPDGSTAIIRQVDDGAPAGLLAPGAETTRYGGVVGYTVETAAPEPEVSGIDTEALARLELLADVTVEMSGVFDCAEDEEPDGPTEVVRLNGWNAFFSASPISEEEWRTEVTDAIQARLAEIRRAGEG